jgi:hypothetical protein
MSKRRLVLLSGFLAWSGIALAQQSAPDSVAAIEPSPDATQSKEDHRIFGVLPNYRTADGTKPFGPLTSAQKFHIAVKDTFDYPLFGLSAAFAGLYQLENQNPSFGQGVKGYAHRYGTSYLDNGIGNMMTEGIMPSLLKQDPRYFRKVHGTPMARVGYALTRVLICKTDSGKPDFNYSEVVGNGLVAALANAYYPDNRTAHDTVERLGTQIGTDAISNVLKEFWPDIKKKFFHRGSASGND